MSRASLMWLNLQVKSSMVLLKKVNLNRSELIAGFSLKKGDELWLRGINFI